MDEQWQGAFEDDNSQKRPIEEHVQMMLTFVQEHETILQTISKNTRVSIAPETDSHYQPVQIALDPIERVFPQDLISIPKDHYTNSQFHVFREFLHDDYISAYLSREFRWYKKHRNEPEINNMYPYERASKFVKDIRNALGYVRMVRSASMYYCSEAVKYLPELDEIVSFEAHAGKGAKNKIVNDDGTENEVTIPNSGANLSEETVRSGKNLDDVISTLIRNFGEGSDYFKVLVNVFQTVLLSEVNEHLKSFFMIVPALCISWADASLQAKDNMYKATRGVTKEMYFSDDGFAMGIAYCLAITKQTRKFEALHWVDSVRSKLKLDTKQLEVQQNARALKEAKMKEEKNKEARKQSTFSFFSLGKKQSEEKTMDEDYEDMEEVHLLQLSSKRLEAMRRETEQLFFSLSSAQIFFKRTDVDT
eukprot:gene17779-23383_t